MYGQGGAGKTTLAASAADSEYGARYLHCDAEGGVSAVEDKSNVEVVEIFKYADFKKLTDEVSKHDFPFKSIGFDNMVEIVGLCLEEITGNSRDQVEIQEWGKMTREILFRVRMLRDAARKNGVNVFLMAWDADEKDDRGVIKKDLAFTPALRKEYPGIVTVIGHVAVTNDPNKRMLNFAPSPRTVSKFRRAASSAAQKIPFQIYYGMDKLPMPDILAVLRGGKEWPASKYPESGT